METQFESENRVIIDNGQYFLGNERDAAHELFRQLKGDPDMVVGSPI
ncbi:MAG: hypothetical protein JKY70_10795 [Mucilaginibacter sp.]|nr:hypothetical protein [Mucilaginibacter sp.]